MRQYLHLLERVLEQGEWQDNRTGIRTLRVEGATLDFDLRQGFPAVTTKQLAFNAVKAELLGFIRGYDNAAQFRKLGCKVWDQNANENQQWLDNPNRNGDDDLGRVYGVQWRDWGNGAADSVDQLANAVGKIKNNPTDRRIIVTAWNPGELNQMALPPCHLLFQFLVSPDTNELSLCMYQRSCDLFLGIPFNIASYALLLELVARATGLIAKKLVMFLADVHIYENHMEQVQKQLCRTPYLLPKLCFGEIDGLRKLDGLEYLESIQPHHIWLENYDHHSAIKAPMAV